MIEVAAEPTMMLVLVTLVVVGVDSRWVDDAKEPNRPGRLPVST